MKEGHHHIKDMDWEAQGEIKGSLEEVGEGDQTVVVVATLDGPVDSRPTALFVQVAALLAHSSFFPFLGCQIVMTHTMTLKRGRESTGRRNVKRKEGEDI